MMQRWWTKVGDMNRYVVCETDALAEIKSAEERGYAKAITYSGLEAARKRIRAEGAQAERERIGAAYDEARYNHLPHQAFEIAMNPSPAEPNKIEPIAIIGSAWDFTALTQAEKINELVSVINAMRIAVDNLEAHAGFKS